MVIKTENINTFTLHTIDPDHIGLVVFDLKDDYSCLQHLHLTNRRSFYTVIYLISGTMQLSIDGYLSKLECQQVISFGPGTELQFPIEKEQKEGWIVLFEKPFVTARYTDHVLHHFNFLKKQKAEPQHVPFSEGLGLSMILETMQREYAYKHPDAKDILRSYLHIFLGTLGRSIFPEAIVGVKNEKEEKVLSFERLISEQYAKERLPSFYADRLFITTNYLNRLCQERRGKSAGQLIRQYVLLEAENLLIHSGKNISEISFELGFENVSYFITFFKKKFGISPDGFRKKNSKMSRS